MTSRQLFTVLGLATAALIFIGFTLYEWLNPAQRALKKAKKGDLEGAEADLRALLTAGDSAGVRSALGKVLLMAGRPEAAASELGKAVELGDRSAGTLNAFGWALVGLGRFGQALPIAEEAHKKAHEDFEVYCLYCGLMARSGRAANVAGLYEFLQKTAGQIQKMNAKAFRDLEPKYEFARSGMAAAGLA